MMWTMPLRFLVMFLFFRTKPVTEKNLTRGELLSLCQYHTKRHPTTWVKYTVGAYTLDGNNVLHDRYNFEPQPGKGWYSYVVKFLLLWQRGGYNGYEIRVQLPAQYL